MRENESLSQENEKLQQSNKRFLQENEELIKNKKILICEVNELTEQKQNSQIALAIHESKNKTLQEQNIALTEQLSITTQNQQELARQAFSAYCEVLDSAYAQKESEYDDLVSRLMKAYDEQQAMLIDSLEKDRAEMAADLDICRKELNKIRATRAAAMEAQLKEREIKEQRAFYSLPISAIDLEDIKALEAIKPRLSKPRVLSMLIWQTYFQKPMTQLCNNVLGAATVCGIYKITNQNNDMCYIGQSVDVATRWKDHAKCGLGIDTPQGNKLYAAMIEEGLWNFTFELLEKCTRAELDEKERNYIEIYDAATYGYNILKGNKNDNN